MTTTTNGTEITRGSYRGYTIAHSTTLGAYWIEQNGRCIANGANKADCRRQIDRMLAPKTKSWSTAW